LNEADGTRDHPSDEQAVTSTVIAFGPCKKQEQVAERQEQITAEEQEQVAAEGQGQIVAEGQEQIIA
jgi:hypothetical protein